MKKTIKIVYLVAGILLLVSCGSDNLTENLYQNQGNETTRTILDLNWDQYQDGAYKEADAKKDFITLSKWNNRVSIQDKALNVKLLANELSGNGGIVAQTKIPSSDEYLLSFDVRFSEDFIWGKGGKVGFGLLIGEGNTGCDKADDGNGGSARMMWYTSDNGDTRFKPYMYYKDMPGDCGDNLKNAAAYPASGSLEKGKWYNIEIYVKSNTGDNVDGHVTYKVDGHVILDENIRWTTNDQKRLISELTFATFRGGSENVWKTDVDTNLKLDNLKLKKLGTSDSATSNSGGIIFPEANQTNIEEGATVVFSDYSTRVASRQWTFEGGSISTSAENRVSVTYDTKGEYAATLTVTFTDGSTKSETIKIIVTGEYVPLVSVEGPTFVFYSEDVDLPQDFPSFSVGNSGVGLAKFVSSGFEGQQSINIGIDPNKTGTFAMLQIKGTKSYDLSEFRNGYLNLALKSTNTDLVNVRIEGGGAFSFALVAPGDYGFVRDGQWHFISIPMEDVLSQIASEAGKMSLLTNFSEFRYRNQGGLDKTTFDHYLDFIFFSKERPVLNL